MKTEFKEPAKHDPECELRLGVASWAKGNNAIKSIKYAKRGKTGRITRSGEIPVEALRQALDFAIRNKYLKS